MSRLHIKLGFIYLKIGRLIGVKGEFEKHTCYLSYVVLQEKTIEMDDQKYVKQIRVMVWSNPRSCSTAFMRTTMCIPFVKLIGEPFQAANYLGPDREFSTEESGEVERAEMTYDKIKSWLEEEYEEYEVVVVKELTFQLQGRLNSIPSGYSHVFLIRDPEKVVKSMYHAMMNSYPKNLQRIETLKRRVDMKATWNIYEHIKRRYGYEPLIIDADDLLNEPRAVLEEFCRRTGIQFREEMLSWKSTLGAKFIFDDPRFPRLNWHDGMVDNAMNTTCFVKGLKPKDVTMPEEAESLIAENRIIYQMMYDKRFVPSCS